jgi:hypothetical protein
MSSAFPPFADRVQNGCDRHFFASRLRWPAEDIIPSMQPALSFPRAVSQQLIVTIVSLIYAIFYYALLLIV